MAKVKYNVKGVESRGAQTVLPKGNYPCKIESADVSKPQGKDRRIEVVYVVNSGDHKGRKLYDYVNLEREDLAWKLRGLLEAVGQVKDGKGETGTLDTDKLVGEVVMVQVRHRTGEQGTQWAGEVQHTVGSVFSTEDAEEEEGEDLDDEEEEEEEEEEEAEDEDEVDLDELDRAGLKEFIKENELEIKVLKKHSDDEIRAAIAEAMGEEEAEEEEEEEEEEDDEETVDYTELSADDLRKTCKERGLSTKGSATIMAARLKKADEKSGKDPF